MRFSIITPWLPPRQTVHRTVECIDKQTYDDWEHIVMIDDPDAHLESFDPRRRIYNCPEFHNTFGNKCRHDAWDLVTGDWILYLDDDDILYPNCLSVVADKILEEPGKDWGYFSISRLGQPFFHVPAGGGLITGGQVFHKKTTSAGVDVRWTELQEYCGDWEFISRCLIDQPPILISEELGCLPEYHHGIRYE